MAFDVFVCVHALQKKSEIRSRSQTHKIKECLTTTALMFIRLTDIFFCCNDKTTATTVVIVFVFIFIDVLLLFRVLSTMRFAITKSIHTFAQQQSLFPLCIWHTESPIRSLDAHEKYNCNYKRIGADSQSKCQIPNTDGVDSNK